MKFNIAPVKSVDFIFIQGEIVAKLEIKDDITSLEAVNLQLLLIAASPYGNKCRAFVDFIKDKNLERHFTITVPKLVSISTNTD